MLWRLPPTGAELGCIEGRLSSRLVFGVSFSPDNHSQTHKSLHLMHYCVRDKVVQDNIRWDQYQLLKETESGGSEKQPKKALAVEESEASPRRLEFRISEWRAQSAQQGEYGVDMSTAVIDICLNINRYKRSREFRRYARMSPYLFGLFDQQLETQPVFSNNSNNGESQIPVERQLLTTLIRMGSYGNAASLAKISDLCWMGKGTIDKVCRQALTAIQSSTLRITYVRWPVGAE